jgi:putative acyl-CoA dehydrogenase
VLTDGSRNAMRIMRLKNKLGNKSNASAEVEYEGALAFLVGEEGRGVRTIIEMVNMTRLDCVIGSAAGMRYGLTQALHHATHRRAFGKALVDQPLMRNVLADLALESEAATALMLRLAGATDRALDGDAAEGMFRRAALAASKYWVCKRAPAHAAESLECLGGNGYIEESQMPRLFRESPLNGIWEGSGNVAALDLMRALAKDSEAAEAYFYEVALAGDRRVADAAERVRKTLAAAGEADARRLAEEMAVTLQASLLVRHAPAAVADAFCASRLAGDWGRAFGTLPNGLDLDAVIERARPISRA